MSRQLQTGGTFNDQFRRAARDGALPTASMFAAHLSFISDGHRVTDKPQPHAGRRSMIDWIVFDLMRSLPEGEKLAATIAIF